MDRDAILSTLRAHEADLRARGVAHVALFGSRARGDARADSDIDLMVEVEPSARISVWGYAGLKTYLAELFPGPVDVVQRRALKPGVALGTTADSIYVF